jgi:hypothetical protein
MLERIFFEHFGEPFVKSAMEAVFLARRDAWDYCGGHYDYPEARNTRPWMVRGNLEQLLRAAAERHGLESKVAEKPDTEFWYHTEVLAGPCTLTAATVPSPGAMVRASDYRRGLAFSGQGELFPHEARPDKSASIYYVILLHSRYRGNKSEEQKYGHLPGSIYLAWPARDCQGYVHTVNLIERYQDVALRHTPKEWEEEAVLRYLRAARKFGIAV